MVKKPIFFLAVLTFFLAACGRLVPAAQPSLSPSELDTAIAIEVSNQLTLQAAFTALAHRTETAQVTLLPSPSPTGISTPNSTETPTPNIIPPIPSDTPTFTPRPARPTATPIPCGWAAFVKDITVKDGTVFSPEQSFKKTWRLKNIGACRWTKNYSLVFYEGARMSGPPEKHLGVNVDPGQSIDITIPMKSPKKTGSYKGYWLLADASGHRFGIGKGANEPIWVSIKVANPTPTPTRNPPTPTPKQPTPTASNTPTATPQQPIYSFAKNYCQANWSSSTEKLPCPMESSTQSKLQTGPTTKNSKPGPNPNPLIMVREGAYFYYTETLEVEFLEARLVRGPTLVVKPDAGEKGYIRADYPAINVVGRSYFKTETGCLASAVNCDVTYQLQYRINNGKYQTIADWIEKFDGKLTKIEVDVSNLAGKSVQFSLVILNNYDSNENWVFWLDPRLEWVPTPSSQR